MYSSMSGTKGFLLLSFFFLGLGAQKKKDLYIYWAVISYVNFFFVGP